MIAVLSAPTVTADWLQPGGDGGRTGFVAEAGPRWDDIAFNVTLSDASRPDITGADPLIVGGDVILIVPGPSPRRTDVFRVPLDSPMPVRINKETLPFRSDFAVADGSTLFLLANPDDEIADAVSFLFALNLTTGAEIGRVELRLETDPNEEGGPQAGVTTCEAPHADMVLSDGVVYVTCSNTGAGTPGVPTWAIDAQNLSVVWSHTLEDSPAISPSLPSAADPSLIYEQTARTPYTIAMAGASRAPTYGGYAGGIAVAGPWVLVSGLSWNPGGTDESLSDEAVKGGSAFVRALDRATGDEVWVNATNAHGLGSQSPIPDANIPPAAITDGKHVFLEMTSLRAFALPGNGSFSQGFVEFRPAYLEGDRGSGMAISGKDLYVTSRTGLHQVNLETRSIGWSRELAPNLQWAPGGLVLAGSTIIGRAGPFEEEPLGRFNVLTVRDAETGDEVWSKGFPSNIRFAVSDGAIAVWEPSRGDLTVIGHTVSSLQPKTAPLDLYPEPGDEVIVDLSATERGFFGTAEEFKAIWGDGSITEWQRDPILVHRYSAPFNANARFLVRNANGQTASTEATFYVGADPSQNFLEAAFNDDNQDRTFFILGLLLTLLGALYGLWRIRRSRSILDRELRAIDQVRMQNLEDPARLEAALAERKTHVRGLLAAGRIDQAGFLLLEKRIDELGRGRRLETIDHGLKFLPLSLVETLREMLTDGRVTEWERRHFIDAIEKDGLLSKAQKDIVRRQVDDWFERDKQTA